MHLDYYKSDDIKVMLIGEQIQGGEFTDGKYLSQFIKLATEKVNKLPDGSKVLLLGGGTMTLPKKIKRTIELTVIEKYPAVYEMAMNKFEYEKPDNHSILIGDAERLPDDYYDCIVMDLPIAMADFVGTEWYQKAMLKQTDYIIYNALGFLPPVIANTTVTPLMHEVVGVDWYLVEVRKEQDAAKRN